MSLQLRFLLKDEPGHIILFIFYSRTSFSIPLLQRKGKKDLTLLLSLSIYLSIPVLCESPNRMPDPMAEGARDLLRRLSGGFSADEVTDGDSEEIDLRLSLGGCYNSQDAENSRLIRSSSIPALLQSDFTSAAHLVRSSSMPSEGEEMRRRKEMQSMKRMEAKRKREGKRSLKRFDEDLEGGGGSAGKKMRRFEVEENGVESSSRRLGVASQGSSSSGESEFQSGQGFEFPGIICASDASTPSNAPTTSRHNNHKAPSVPTPTSKYVNNTVLHHGIMFNKNFSKKNERERSLNGGKIFECKNMTGETDNMMEEMPSVSTRGDGPNGRRIEGFLYRYGKGEVSIVCVCHGSFLTPSEFVKHAGGGDVAHPLRHIVVNLSHDSML